MHRSVFLADAVDQPTSMRSLTDTKVNKQTTATDHVRIREKSLPCLRPYNELDMSVNTTGWRFDNRERMFAYSDVSPTPITSTLRQENQARRQDNHRPQRQGRHSSNPPSTSDEDEPISRPCRPSCKETDDKRSIRQRTSVADFHRSPSNSSKRPKSHPKQDQQHVKPVYDSDSSIDNKTPTYERRRRHHYRSSSRHRRSSDDSRPQPNRHRYRKAMEVRRYNGKDGIDEYLTQFELATHYNGWSEKEKATALLCALDGAARSILASFDDPTTASYRQIKLSLQKRFSTTDLTEVHESALSQLRLSRDQGIRELASEVARLNRKAYPDLDVKQRERFALKWFLNAISDKDTVFYIKDKEPTTMNEACTLYERFDALRGSGSRRIATAKYTNPPDPGERTHFSHDAVQTNADRLCAENQEQIRQLTSAFQKLGSVVNQRAQPVNSAQVHWQTTAPQSASTNGNIPRKPCPQCHLAGHWKRDCPQLKSATEAECFECHGYGHRWRNCPLKQSGNGQGPTSAPNSRSAGHTPTY